MNTTSSAVTGGVTVTAATLTPLVTWAMNGFPHPVPESVPYLIAATIVTGAHLCVNLAAQRMQAKQNAALPKGESS
jgi:hypothetical protein